MTIAILTMVVVWCTFYTMVPNGILMAACISIAILSVISHRHEHEGVLDVDCVAQQSRLNSLNPVLKFWSALALMFICVASNTPVTGVFLAILMMLITVIIGKVRLKDYIDLLTIPMVFLFMSGLALLFDFTATTITSNVVIEIPVFNHYLTVTHKSQLQTILVMSKAMGSISCLYFLSLSTPMAEIIGVMKKSKVPTIVIELMYLIYRYTFILFDMHHAMKEAAASRLGFVDFRTGVRTTGLLFAHLLARSYRKASNNFDAMESRCYTGEIEFLENEKAVRTRHVLAMGTLLLCVAALAIIS